MTHASEAPNVGLNAVAGCPPEEYNLDPTEYEQMRPDCFDSDLRVLDMSAAGILAGSHPDRLIPMSSMPLRDPQLMADEIRRVAAKGCHAVTFSENPAKLGLPSYHTEHCDPFFKACADGNGTSA